MCFSRIKDMVEKSGDIAIGGKMDATDKFISPTVLVNVKEEDPIMQQEIFGPILSILNVDSPEEAAKFINNRQVDTLPF